MSNGSNPVNWQAACELAQRETSKARAQLQSSADEIGRLTKALRRLAEFPADDAGLSEGALSKYWKQRIDTARDIARAALTTPTTEPDDG